MTNQWWPGWQQDVRSACRALSRQHGFAAVVVLTLALGVGFSIAAFTVANAVILAPLPFADPDELLVLRERRLPDIPDFSISPGHYLTWRARTRTFDGIAAWRERRMTLDAAGSDPELVRVALVSANLFPLLGTAPALGRTFTTEEEEAGEAVALMSHGAWQRRFGARADIIGQTLRVNRNPVVVVGIMPAGFEFPSAETEIWLPLSMSPEERERYGSHYLSALARMKDGVGLDEARADLNRVARELAAERPDEANRGWEVLAFPMHEYLVRDVDRALLLLLAAAAVLMLIACANVAGLLIARASARRREMAVRIALGASRARLVPQLLVEQSVLAAAAAGAGLILARSLLGILTPLTAEVLPRHELIHIDEGVLGVTVLLAVLTALVSGLLPALQTSRDGTAAVLAGVGRLAGGPPATRLRRALMAAEVALAFVLLVGASLLVRSLLELRSEQPGFVPEGALLAGLSLPAGKYPHAESRLRFFDGLLGRLRTLPQVQSAGYTSIVPMLDDYLTRFEIEGRAASDADRPGAGFAIVSPGYFEAMGIPIKQGRDFTDADRAGAPPVVLVNEALVQQHLAGRDPIGARIRVAEGANRDAWKEIVGVVGDVKAHGLAEPRSAQIYEVLAQHPYLSGLQLVVRARNARAMAIVPLVRSVVRDIDREVPLWRIRRLEDVVDDSIGPQRLSTSLLSTFSAAALILTLIGVYAALSYIVSLRTREFAVRIAHGATRGDILRRVLSEAGGLAVIGVAAGVLAAWPFARSVETLLFGVTAWDPTTYAFAAVMLVALAIVAGALPALRATRTDAMVLLRGE